MGCQPVSPGYEPGERKAALDYTEGLGILRPPPPVARQVAAPDGQVARSTHLQGNVNFGIQNKLPRRVGWAAERAYFFMERHAMVPS